jgi:hypothetical protein
MNHGSLSHEKENPMKKLLLLALVFAACAAPIALDEDGEPIATEVTVTQDRSSLLDTLEPDALLDSSPEDLTPPATIPDEDWTDDDLTPQSVIPTGQTKWKKGKTYKDITSTGVNTRRIPTQFSTAVQGYYKIKIKASTGYMFASKVASASGADFTVPPAYTATRQACAQFETFRTTYRREEHEYVQNLINGKKIWQATGNIRTILNSKPPKEKTKRQSPWSIC